jgi:hypothetical protein
MKIKNTGHGSVAELEQKEVDVLQSALDILGKMHRVETEDGTLQIKESPLVVAAYGSVLGLMRERGHTVYTGSERCTD